MLLTLCVVFLFLFTKTHGVKHEHCRPFVSRLESKKNKIPLLSVKTQLPQGSFFPGGHECITSPTVPNVRVYSWHQLRDIGYTPGSAPLHDIGFTPDTRLRAVGMLASGSQEVGRPAGHMPCHTSRGHVPAVHVHICMSHRVPSCSQTFRNIQHQHASRDGVQVDVRVCFNIVSLWFHA